MVGVACWFVAFAAVDVGFAVEFAGVATVGAEFL